MNYVTEELNTMYTDLVSLTKKEDELTTEYIFREYKNTEARMYAREGFSRRIWTMNHCIKKIFEKLPPENIDMPESETIFDATVYLQAFVFNTFGSLDNLARIWVREMDVKENGKPLEKHQIGLREKNREVMDSLPEEIKKYLCEELEEWWENLIDFRDALAHRIPLYIPPQSVNPVRANEYWLLEDQIWDAMNKGDNLRVHALEKEQRAYIFFEPVTRHYISDPETEESHDEADKTEESQEKSSEPVLFHSRILEDFNTVEQIAKKILHALNSH